MSAADGACCSHQLMMFASCVQLRTNFGRSFSRGYCIGKDDIKYSCNLSTAATLLARSHPLEVRSASWLQSANRTLLSSTCSQSKAIAPPHLVMMISRLYATPGEILSFAASMVSKCPFVSSGVLWYTCCSAGHRDNTALLKSVLQNTSSGFLLLRLASHLATSHTATTTAPATNKRAEEP